MNIIRKYFWYVPSVIWMIIIFRLSGQVGSVSSGLSLRVTRMILPVVRAVYRVDMTDTQLIIKLNPYIRKVAHMSEYGILFILLFLSFIASFRATRSMVYAILTSFLYACTDEFHQTFVSARAGEFTDVCIDMTGVLAAVTVTLLIYSAWQGHREKRAVF